MDIKLGTRVEWIGRSGGGVAHHTGTVVQVVLPGWKPSSEWIGLHNGAGVGDPRSHESYVIEEVIGKRKPRHYWPRVSALKVVQ